MGERILIREVQFRNPYRVGRLPLVASCYRAGYDARRKSFLGRVCRKLARLAFHRLHALGAGGVGEMTVRVDGQDRVVRFDARNLQFHSIYLPHYLNGPEPQLAALFDVLVPADGVFLDVGSNWGYHAVAVAARPGFRGRVHAFEPVPATFRDMVAVVEQSGLTGRVTCHNIGLSDRDGAGTMVIPDGLHSGLASIRDESAGGLRVKLRPLAGLAGPDPDVIKLDVEGHELAALRGAEPVLRRARPMLTFEDWHRPDTAGPVDYLTELGYRLYLPAWWVHNQPIRPGHDLSPSDLTRLALVPLGPGQRDELAGREDLFACPVERMGELESRFGFTPIA